MKAPLNTLAIHSTHAPLSHSLAVFFTPLAQHARTFIAQRRQDLTTWNQRRRTRLALRELDNNALKDIGVSRAEALNEANKPFWKG